jgi:hypothetical protein
VGDGGRKWQMVFVVTDGGFDCGGGVVSVSGGGGHSSS